MKFSKRLIKKAFNLIGLDLVRSPNVPTHMLLGLRNLPIRTIIDIGANEGQFARKICKVFPHAKIYCFEPLREPFEKLNKWAAQTGDKVIPSNLALGNTEGMFEMFSHVEHSSSSSFLKTTTICETYYPFTKKQVALPVKVTTLDNWMRDLPIAPSLEILLKLDVQGYEDRIIRGGERTFRLAKACILELCLHQLYEEQATFKDILLQLNDFGYHYGGNLQQIYAEDGHVIYIDTVFVKTPI